MPMIDTLKKLVKKTKQASTTHDWELVERMYHLSTMIAEQEGADVVLFQVGANLHDIGRVIREPHILKGRGWAKGSSQWHELSRETNCPRSYDHRKAFNEYLGKTGII